MLAYQPISQQEAEAVIRQLQAEGYTIEDVTTVGATPLHIAAQQGNESVFRAFIACGANTHALDMQQTSLVGSAAMGGNAAILQYLIDNKHDFSKVGYEGSALHYLALGSGEIEYAKIVALILRAGVPVDARNESQETPLHLAAKYGNQTLFEALRDRGADLNAKNQSGESVVAYAMIGGNVPICVYIRNLDFTNVGPHGSAWHYLTLTNQTDPLHIKGVASFIATEALEAINDDVDTLLLMAAKNGNAPVFQELLNRGANLDVVDENGAKPLACAVKKGSPEIIKMLCEKGVDVNQTGPEGSALHYLGYCNESDPEVLSEIIQILVDHGANLFELNNQNLTSWECAQDVNPAVETALLQARGSQGDTYLHHACEIGNLELVKRLLQQKEIDIDVENEDEERPIASAIKKGEWAVAQFLCNQGCNVSSIGPEGSALHYLAYCESSDSNQLDIIVKKLIASGCKIDERNKDGQPPLHFAALYGNEAVFDALLRAGADIEKRDDEDDTLVPYAMEGGNYAIITYVLQTNLDATQALHSLSHCKVKNTDFAKIIELCKKYSIDINAKDGEGKTPLLDAAKRGNALYFNELINQGANTSIQDSTGKSVVAYAVEGGNLTILKWLIEKKFDFSEVGPGGTALHYLGECQEADNVEEILELLLAQDLFINESSDWGTPLHSAAFELNLPVIKALVEKGADVFVEDNNEDTPLQCALKASNEVDDEVRDAVIAYLIDLKNEEGDTALHDAVYAENLHLIKKLIEHGAQFLKDNDGDTPLHLTVNTPFDDKKLQLQIITVLVKAGADINDKNKKGETPLSLAKNDPEILAALNQK